MEVGAVLDAAGHALVMLADPYRFALLSLGAFLGVILGILPGIGGLAGTALLLPFTLTMDPYTAFAFLLGLASTTATGDPIPAILFGVPGGAGSAATVLDGLPMAKRGEAGRALSAAYMSSIMGGVFGALLMAVALPLIRPFILFIGSPELLAFTVFGISMVAVLSGKTPLRGMIAAGLGLILAMVGTDPQTGTLRWTMGSLYLWNGVPLLPVILGVFALPELCDLAISRTAIAGGAKYDIKSGMWQGAKDCFINWWLVLRCSWLGAMFGSVPGIGGAIVDWLAYGHALKTEKGAAQTFGTGDVRGVIASESANNAREGGALIPTIAFGVPGSAGMAILIGAFLIQGLIPGPDMLTKNLDVTYSMVWSVALANIVGGGLCYLFSGQFAKIATLRYTLILPSVLGIIYIGAFEGSRDWGDLYTLLIFGVVGWIMKQLKWPRPPLILGFVLGDVFERYMFISVGRYGAEWLTRPVVMGLLAMAVFGLLRPLWQDVRTHGGLRKMATGFGAPRFHFSNLFYLFVIVVLGAMLATSLSWHYSAKVVPLIVGSIALTFALLSLGNEMFRRLDSIHVPTAADGPQKIHMDLESDTAHVAPRLIILRAATFFGWMIAFMASMATIGLIPTVPLFVIAYMRSENSEPWKLVIPQAICLTIFIYAVFDQMLTIPWPQTLMGGWFPALKFVPSL